MYRNKNASAVISSVEFAPVAEGNFTFFYVGNPLQRDHVRQWLTTAEVGQEIIAETQVNGHTVFITHGDKKHNEILDTLAKHGDHFVQEQFKRKFDPWMTRAVLGFTGQSMQLVSSTLGRDRKVKWDTALFAVSNLLANTISFIYGSQKSEDIHRLRFLKNKFNNELGRNVPEGEALPGVNDNRLEMHEEKPHQLKTGVNHFLQRNSVRVGEIALRYFGAMALVFPTYGWGRAAKEFRKSRSISSALMEARNRDRWAYGVGLTSVVGKTIALFSKEEDPYNPKPHTRLDTIREKVTFPLGGMIESAAFGAYTYDRFAHHKMYIKDKPHADYIGGAGSALFVGAYVIRSGWAKFSEKSVNMDELYAHVSDSLAHIPPDKLPQLMADTAASIKAHFKDKPMDFGEVFTRLMTDAYRYHHIAIQNQTAAVESASEKAPVHGKRTLVATKRSLKDRVEPAVAGHADKIASETKPQQGLST